MSDSPDTRRTPAGPTIDVIPNGPLIVKGDVALYRRRAVHSEHGEPLTWVTTERLPRPASAYGCAAAARAREAVLRHHPPVHRLRGRRHASGTLRRAVQGVGRHRHHGPRRRSICVHAGFCGTRVTNVWKQVGETDESIVRLQVIDMVEKCPSGALVYELEGTTVEPLLPQAIAVTDDGPLWVTGGMPCRHRGRAARDPQPGHAVPLRRARRTSRCATAATRKPASPTTRSRRSPTIADDGRHRRRRTEPADRRRRRDRSRRDRTGHCAGGRSSPPAWAR